MVVVLRQLLFGGLLLKQGRRVRSLHFLHEVLHQFFAEAVKGTPCELVTLVIHHIGLCLIHSADRFVDLRWLLIIFGFLDGGRHGIGLHLNVLLNLILLILNGLTFKLVSRHVYEFILEEFAVSEGAKLLTQFKVL